MSIHWTDRRANPIPISELRENLRLLHGVTKLAFDYQEGFVDEIVQALSKPRAGSGGDCHWLFANLEHLDITGCRVASRRPVIRMAESRQAAAADPDSPVSVPLRRIDLPRSTRMDEDLLQRLKQALDNSG